MDTKSPVVWLIPLFLRIVGCQSKAHLHFTNTSTFCCSTCADMLFSVRSWGGTNKDAMRFRARTACQILFLDGFLQKRTKVRILGLIPLLILLSFFKLKLFDQLTFLLIFRVLRVPSMPGRSFKSQLIHNGRLFFCLQMNDTYKFTTNFIRFSVAWARREPLSVSVVFRCIRRTPVCLFALFYFNFSSFRSDAKIAFS